MVDDSSHDVDCPGLIGDRWKGFKASGDDRNIH